MKKSKIVEKNKHLLASEEKKKEEVEAYKLRFSQVCANIGTKIDKALKILVINKKED